MNWYTIILLVFSVATPLTYADDSQSCGIAQIDNVIKNVKTIIEEEWESKGDTPDVILQKLGLKLKEILSTSENTVENCAPEEKLVFEHALSFASKMLMGETNPAEEVLPLVEGDQVLDDFTKLICEVNCSYVAEFATQLNQPSSKIRIYQTLTNLLQNAKLKNKRVDTPPYLPLVKVLNNIAHQENDASVAVVLKTLLRQAIKTELDMEFGNSGELYEINQDLTSEIIQQLIHENLIAQDKCEETGLGVMHVFEIIKTRKNMNLWLQNLELIFKELKKMNKLNTMNSVIILGLYKEMQNDKDFAEAMRRWDEIVKELPERAHKIVFADLCSKLDAGYKKYKAYVTFSSAGVDVKKLAPSDHNTKSAFSTFMSGTNMTLLVDYIPANDYKFEFPVEVEHGNLVQLPKEEIEETIGYGCQPLGGIFMQADEPASCKLKKIIDCLLNAA